MSDYVPMYKKGGVYHPLNIIDISTSDEEVEVEDVIITIETSEEEMEVVDKVEKVLYFTVLYNTVIYCSVLYYKVQVVGGIIDISTSSDEEEEVDVVDVVEEVVKEVVLEEVVEVVEKVVAKRVDFTITLHQKCTWRDGSGRMVVVRTTYFYYK